MISSKARRIASVSVIVLALVAVGAATAIHMAAQSLRSHIVEILGPNGHAERIDVGFSRITLDQVEIKAPSGWPSADTLRAQRIVLTPDLWQLLSHRIAIRHAELDGAYLSILRRADGKISLLPNLQSTATSSSTSSTSEASGSSGAQTAVALGAIHFRDATLDFFDGSVATPPFRLQLTQLQSTIGPLRFPSQGERTQVSIAGNLVGPHSTGAIQIDGWIVFRDQQSDIRTRFEKVDVAALKPYLNKSKTLALDSGLASLDVHSTIENRQLQANGSITLEQLQLARGDGPVSALQAIPREAAIAALKNKHNQIKLDFTMQGNLSDPTFSLNEGIATRLAAGMAKALGVSAEGVARSVGDTTKGLGGALLNLIGK